MSLRAGTPAPAKASWLRDRALRASWLHPVLLVFLVGLLARVLLALLIPQLFGGALLSADSLGYHDMATAMSTGQTEGWDPFTHSLYGRTATFLIPLTTLYSLFEPSVLLGGVFVSLIGAVTAAITARVTKEALHPMWALTAGLLVALLPSQVLWSSVTLKDPAVWLLWTILALLVAVAGRKHGVALLPVALALVAVLVMFGYLRQHSLVVAAFALMLTAWVGSDRGRITRLVGAVTLAVAVPWVIGLGPAGWSVVSGKSLENMRLLNAAGADSAIVEAPRTVDPADVTDPLQVTAAREAEGLAVEADKLEQLVRALAERVRVTEAKARRVGAAASGGAHAERPDTSVSSTPAKLAENRQAALRRRAERLRAKADRLRERIDELRRQVAARVATPSDVRPIPLLEEDGSESSFDANVAHLPRGVSVMLLEPFPWASGGSTGLQLARAETLLWYPVLALALIGVMNLWRHRRVLLFPFVAGGALVVVYALSEGNLGTAYRHRGEFVWAVAVFAGFGVARVSAWIRKRRAEPGDPSQA